MKKLLKNSCVGLVALLMLAIEPILYAPMYWLCLKLCWGASRVVVYTTYFIITCPPIAIMIFLLICLAKRTIDNIKYWLYGIGIQIVIGLILASLIDYRNAWYKLIYFAVLLLIQVIGIIWRRRSMKSAKSLESNQSETIEAKYKVVSTPKLWILFVKFTLGYQALCGLALFVCILAGL